MALSISQSRKNHLMRILSGIIAVPLVVGIIYYGSEWLFLALAFTAVGIGTYEYFSMIAKTGIDGFPRLGMGLSLSLTLCFFFAGGLNRFVLITTRRPRGFLL